MGSPGLWKRETVGVSDVCHEGDNENVSKRESGIKRK